MFVTNEKRWRRLSQGGKNELKEGSIESKESQVTCSGEINRFEVGRLVVSRCKREDDR